MKKLAKVIESVGALLFFLWISVDVVDNPITAVPALIGLLLIYLGTKIEGGWTDAEEIIEDCNFSADESDTDDSITYITYDCSGTERYMDSK